MCAFKPQQILKWSCIIANQKVLTPISYGGEMRHTVPLFCYKSCFVDGWQLFIRSNLFKPPLRMLTFSTLTHLQLTNCIADLLHGEGENQHPNSFSLRPSVVSGWVEGRGGRKLGTSTRSEFICTALFLKHYVSKKTLSK